MAWPLPAAAFVAAVVLIGSASHAQGTEEIPDLAAGPDDSAVQRQLWQERVRSEKRRIQELARERRLSPPQQPTVVDESRRASERVMNDVTLQPSDIVVTDRGTFVFRGNGQDERLPDDFVRLRRPDDRR